MQTADLRALLAELDKRVAFCARAIEDGIGILPGSERSPIQDSIRENGRLMTEAREAIGDLAIRCGLLMPPRTVRLSDLVSGREPFELGTMERLALSLGNLIAVFREDGATLDTMARALRFEAEALEVEDAEDQRRAGYEPIS